MHPARREEERLLGKRCDGVDEERRRAAANRLIQTIPSQLCCSPWTGVGPLRLRLDLQLLARGDLQFRPKPGRPTPTTRIRALRVHTRKHNDSKTGCARGSSPREQLPDRPDPARSRPPDPESQEPEPEQQRIQRARPTVSPQRVPSFVVRREPSAGGERDAAAGSGDPPYVVVAVIGFKEKEN
ncbi:unnamed protein product [Cuscuta campestris]|uniref:Uncharacterized protein n=1 Tax=Cuscuta campestris TaxID=132261 RepID=A0A484LYG5_9ASTE|nr:unnamed protein product [Cuscuta campestris]